MTSKNKKTGAQKIKKAGPATETALQNVQVNHTDDKYKLSSGHSAQSVQKQVIRYLLSINQQLEKSTPMERLKLSGTDAIRELVAPLKNPMQYISELRQLNSGDCIQSVNVDEARVSNHGKAPVHYYLPLTARPTWRKTVASKDNG